MDAGESEPPALRPSWRTILGVFVALLVAGIALGQLQGLLQGMHLSARPAASIGGLNHLFHWGADSTTSSGTVQVWKEYADSTSGQGTADAYEVAWWAVAIDFLLFAPLYTLGLVLVLRNREQLHPSLDAYRKLASFGIALILLGFLADEVENVMNIAIVNYGWSAEPDYDAGSFDALTWALWVSGWVKWAAVLAAAGLALVLVWVAFTERFEVVREWWKHMRKRLHLLRMQLLLVGLIAFIPFGHEQIPDLIRRWTPVQLALSVALAWTFALTTWLIGRRLLVCGQWQPDWVIKKSEKQKQKRKKIARALFLALLLLAAIQGVAHVLSHGRYQPGWGLAIPAVLLAGLAILGWLLPAQPPRDPFPAPPLAPDAPHPRLPRALASFTLVAFGLGVLQASFGYSVYARAWSWQASPLVALALVAVGAVVAALLGRELLIGGGVGALAGLALLRLVDGDTLAPPVLVGAALLLVLAGWRLYEALGSGAVARPKPAVSWKLVLALTFAFLGVYGAIVAFPSESGERIGGVGILLFFVLVLTCAGALLVWVNPALHVPRALGIVGVARFPIVALLVVWFLAASWLDHGGYHNVRLKDAGVPATGVTLEAAWTCWLAKNSLSVESNECAPPGGPATASDGAVPLILVATTGGGIRAAYQRAIARPAGTPPASNAAIASSRSAASRGAAWGSPHTRPTSRRRRRTVPRRTG